MLYFSAKGYPHTLPILPKLARTVWSLHGDGRNFSKQPIGIRHGTDGKNLILERTPDRIFYFLRRDLEATIINDFICAPHENQISVRGKIAKIVRYEKAILQSLQV